VGLMERQIRGQLRAHVWTGTGVVVKAVSRNEGLWLEIKGAG
jgi:hypothetical protein